MGRRIVRQLVSAAAILLAVSLITFGLMALAPGDPVVAILGEGATPGARAALVQQLGLDEPIPVRYAQWLWGVLQGDFGQSFQSGRPVLDSMLERFPVTLELLVGAQVLALVLAIPTAVISAYRARGLFDQGSQVVAMALVSTPQFLVGLLLIYLFSLVLGWFPATGFTPVTESVSGNLRTMILPIVTLALVESPAYMRLLRSEMIQTLQQNFILTARSVGLAPWRILLQHALRPSSLSLVTALGINVGRMIGGAVIVEVLFGLPGLGQMLADAIYQREYLVVQGIVLFVAVMFVMINFAVDLLYGWLDPRVRLSDPAR